MDLEANYAGIMDLPEEVRGIIFKKICRTCPQKLVLMLRLVCHQWCHEVDYFCDFWAKIDDRKQMPCEILRMSEMRLRDCTIQHLIPPMSSAFAFKYPTVLRTLRMPSRSVSADTLDGLLTECGDSLGELVIALPPYGFDEGGFTPREAAYNFKNLKKLSVSICIEPNTTNGSFFSSKVDPKYVLWLEKILRGRTHSIEKLRIDLKCTGMNQMSRFCGIILSFMADCWRTLKTVDLELMQGSHGIPSSTPRPLLESDRALINDNNWKRLTNLKCIRVINSTAMGMDFFSQLLLQQENLKSLDTDILPIPLEIYNGLILKCQDTLVHVDIGDMTVVVEETGPFDMSVFQDCSHLRNLTLDRSCLHRRGFLNEAENRQDTSADLINVFCIPKSLKELALNYFLVLSDELLMLFGDKENCSLMGLSLTQCGDFGSFGVDGSVLQCILSSNIQFIEISRLNFTEPEERFKLNLILTSFGYERDHPYFQVVTRNPLEDYHDFDAEFSDEFEDDDEFDLDPAQFDDLF